MFKFFLVRSFHKNAAAIKIEVASLGSIIEKCKQLDAAVQSLEEEVQKLPVQDQRDARIISGIDMLTQQATACKSAAAERANQISELLDELLKIKRKLGL